MSYIEHIIGIALAVLYWLFTAVVTFRVIGRRNPVSVTLSWLLVIYILPFVGALLYLMLGELNLGRQRARRAEAMLEPFSPALQRTSKPKRPPCPAGSWCRGFAN